LHELIYLHHYPQLLCNLAKKELGADYPQVSNSETNTPLALWYEQNQGDVSEFEKQMRRKVHN
jgi:type I restriction enzyme M protein